MRKMLLVAMFVGVVGLLSAASAGASGQGTQGAASGQGNLAFTGSHETFPLVLVGVGLVVAGGAFVFASRRRFARRA